MKRHPISFVIKKHQSKTTLSCHFVPIQIEKTKHQLTLSYIADGMEIGTATLENSIENLKLNIHTPR